ncbi:Cytochrome Oxidase Biogenesis (Oxa1) Family [Phytophthora cinnamomi]|nr:Cytochrome Oxidase Biogenesis (Oxa1) Family [Phytophthora cinnamomi]
MQRLVQARPDFTKLYSAYKYARTFMPGSDHKGHLDAILLGRQGVKAVMKKHNTRPVQTVMGTVAYIPIFILMAYSARDMVRSGNFAGFESGGLLFWKNLMETDSTYILPILAAASTYGNLEVSIRTKSSFWTQVLQVGQYGTIFAVPFLANLPQGVFFYWLGASWSSMAQTIAMNNNDFRRRIGLKPRISQTDSPATAAAEMLGKNVPDATGGATMVETAATTSKQQ